VDLALALAQRLPNVLDALLGGRIDLYKARIIHQVTDHLDPKDAARVADDVLVKAHRQTASQVRNAARRMAFRVKPKESVKAAQKKAKQARDVRLFHGNDEGNAEILAIISVGDATAIWEVVNAAAWQVKRAGAAAGRSIGELRGDALGDLVLGRDPSHTTDTPDAAATPESSPAEDTTTTRPDDETKKTSACPCGGAKTNPAPKTVVNVDIPLSEFLKLFQDNTSDPGTGAETSTCQDTAPGEVEGFGYVADWVIRDLVQDAAGHPGTAFRGVIYDDTTGAFIAATSLKHRLPAALAEHIKLRDRQCRFPGCRQPARRCDVDHVKAWHLGGETAECNLECLCRHHHRLKQSPAWCIRLQHGIATWTARTGHQWISEPHDYSDGPHGPPDYPGSQTKPSDPDQPSPTG
jgi:Domain of unknown function (DUF222)